MSSDTQKPSKLPTHRVYAVTRKNRDDKGRWNEIGAAWSHRDGKGFSLKLEYLPLNLAEIVVRVPEEKANRQEGGAQ